MSISSLTRLCRDTIQVFKPICSKFIQETVYQISVESPMFCRRYYRIHFGLFSGHTVDETL